MPVDLRAFPVLYVDDEPENLVTFRYALGDRFNVLTAGSGPEALAVLEDQEVAVLLCDQRMPEMVGTEVCRQARTIRPEAVRIIVTAYSDVQAAVDAINLGQVMRYVTKPWRNEELEELLRASIELVNLQRVVQGMQSRLLRAGQGTSIETVHEEIVRELQAPVAMLGINADQVRDLLDAGLSSWRDDARARELVEHARRAHDDGRPPVDQLRGVLDRLRRRQRLDPEATAPRTDVARVVRSTASILRDLLGDESRLQIVLDAAPVARIHTTDLAQALVNLVTNAVQAMGGVHAREPSITIVVGETATDALITVSDRGPGIPAAQHERVFDPFFTTGHGTGLGLSVTHSLIEAAGGSIQVLSHPGQGARFLITVPRSA